TLTASILLALGRTSEAIEEISFVAEHFRGFDHDEAVELWNRIPQEGRPANKQIAEIGLATTEAVRGVLTSVTCGDTDRDTKFVLQATGGPQGFHAGGEHRVRYSDSFFWGFEHYSCHHLSGMRATVRYKPSATKNGEGEWIAVDLSQDLPSSQTSAATPSQGPVTPK